MPYRRFRLRTILALLVLAITVPLALFAGRLFWTSWQQQQRLVDAQNVEQATAVGVAIDLQVERTIAALEVLATLQPIDDPDKTHFIEIAARTLPIHPGWASIRVIDASLKVLSSTGAAAGEKPALLNTNWVRTILETGKPAVSGVRQDPDTGEWFISVGVPVIRAGTLRYVLGARIHASAFSDILKLQRVPPGGVVTLIDTTPVIIARTRNENRYRGQPPTPDFVKYSQSAPEGSWRTRLLEGTEAYSAWNRSEQTGWTVGIALPSQIVDGPVRRSFYALVGVGLAILAGGITFAGLLSAGLVRAQTAATTAAHALASGEAMPPFRSRIVEVEDLSVGLREAESILQARMRERDEAQREADRHRAALLEREQTARRSAEALSRAKDEFVATVSHELRTPLNAIYGWVALMKSGALDAEKQKHALEVIDRNTRAQGQLVEDLLDMSRVIHGSIRLEMRPVDLETVLDSTVESVRPTATARRITITVEHAAKAIVYADHGRLQQVLWNLLANSLKFTGSGGRIEASTGLDGTDAIVRITDNGKGIAPEFLPYLFDRFTQETGNATREHSGLGIGLSLVRHLTELHGGTVTAESRGKDQGATFTVRLPLLGTRADHPATPSPAAVAMPHASARVLEGLHVLAVDDNEDARDLVATALRQAGAVVTTAASLGEAIASLDAHGADLIVSDVAMPNGSGYDLVRAVRSNSRTAALPVIALTAYGRGADRDRALAEGFDAHVGKPFDPLALVGLVASFARPAGS
jgi:signal transduction histidine kinase